MLPHGTAKCLCRGCGAYFLTLRAFDVHRLGVRSERFCMDAPRMAERGLFEDSEGYWRFPKREMPGAFK